MFTRTITRRMGSPTYGNWPWPEKLPLKKNWYHHLSRRNSITDETRTYFVVGDMLLLFVLAYSAYRVFLLSYRSDVFQTRQCFLNNHPPAIIANEFDFQNPEKNRQVARHELDNYREDVVKCKGTGKSVESVIFKY